MKQRQQCFPSLIVTEIELDIFTTFTVDISGAADVFVSLHILDNQMFNQNGGFSLWSVNFMIR